MVQVAGIYAQISAADDSEQADAIGAIVVSVRPCYAMGSAPWRTNVDFLFPGINTGMVYGVQFG